MNNLLFLNLGMGEAIILLVVCSTFFLGLFCLIDIVRSEFKDNVTKLLWVIIVLIAPLIGSILYLLLGRNQKRAVS